MSSAFERYQSGTLGKIDSLEGELPMNFDADPEPKTWSQKNWMLTPSQRAVRRVYELVKSKLEPTDDHVRFTEDDVYVVSFSYVLGNWKALVSTTLPDGMYYEVTYNSTKGETYITSYKQWEHKLISDKEQ